MFIYSVKLSYSEPESTRIGSEGKAVVCIFFSLLHSFHIIYTISSCAPTACLHNRHAILLCSVCPNRLQHHLIRCLLMSFWQDWRSQDPPLAKFTSRFFFFFFSRKCVTTQLVWCLHVCVPHAVWAREGWSERDGCRSGGEGGVAGCAAAGGRGSECVCVCAFLGRVGSGAIC